MCASVLDTILSPVQTVLKKHWAMSVLRENSNLLLVMKAETSVKGDVEGIR